MADCWGFFFAILLFWYRDVARWGCVRMWEVMLGVGVGLGAMAVVW